MAAKVFWLRPYDGNSWHSPGEVATRLGRMFDHVEADRDEGRRIGDKFVGTYRKLMASGLADSKSTPLEVVEHQWRAAVVLRVSDESDETAPFEIVVCTEDVLRLQFSSKTPFQKKRRSAEKAATALGYEIEYFNPDE